MNKLVKLSKYYQHFTEARLRELIVEYIKLHFNPTADKTDLKLHTDAIFLAMREKGIDYGQDDTVFHRLIDKRFTC